MAASQALGGNAAGNGQAYISVSLSLSLSLSLFLLCVCVCVSCVCLRVCVCTHAAKAQQKRTERVSKPRPDVKVEVVNSSNASVSRQVHPTRLYMHGRFAGRNLAVWYDYEAVVVLAAYCMV